MADKKITELTEADAFTGVEPFPIVQGSETKKAYASHIRDLDTPLTASGITVSGDIVPTTPRGASLGTVTNPFSSIFVSSGSIYVESDIPGSEPGIITNVGGDISIDSAGFKLISGSTTPFRLFREGIITIRTDYQDPTSRPLFEIIGNLEGSASLAVNPGTLLQTTAYDGQSNRTIFDSYGSSSFSQLNLRSANGSVFSPTTTGEGVIGRIGSSGWLDGIDFGIPGETALPTRIDFYGEGYTSGSRPTSIKMYTTDEGELDPDGIASLELNKDRLYVLGQISASLQENYVWLGDSNNRNIETPVSSLSTYLTGSLVKSAYISCYNTGSISLLTSGSEQVIDFTSIWTENGISLVDNNKFTFAEPGVYKLEFLTTIENDTNDEQDSWFWIKLNGTNFPNSATKVTVRKQKSNGEHTHQLVSISILGVAQTAGDYVQLYWTGEDTALGMPYEVAAGGHPATPSVTLNIIRVG